jgi:GNAT superfamily N-acetyltransferase
VGDLVVREARPDEVEAIGRLTEQVYRDGGFGSDAYAPVLLDAATRHRDAHLLVALLDGDVVGTLTLAESGQPYAHLAEPDELEVRMLVTAEHARGRGVAAALMDATEARAVERGKGAVVLSTEPGMHAAHRLYERRGYVRVPERDWVVDDGTTLITYRRTL